MPVRIVNNYGQISLIDLQRKIREGYSVWKSPHIGNQHPSNLVCAALGIPLSMVSFTKGERDKNFHPHLRIVRGVGETISNPQVWTPFARMSSGRPVEDYHQNELRRRFPNLEVYADHEQINREWSLAEDVLRVATSTIPQLWYRSVNADGEVSKNQPDTNGLWNKISDNVFRFTNDTHGWVVPLRAQVLFSFVLQSLQSGRDVVYHLSGPQMVGYICGLERMISKAYDSLRFVRPELPETLVVYIVPVASCRMVTHIRNKGSLDALEETLLWYESLKPEERRHAKNRFCEVITQFPEVVRPIESAECLSQYDVESADELVLSKWMLESPLSRVEGIHNRLVSYAA